MSKHAGLDGSLLVMKFMTRHFLRETSHVELLSTPDLTAPNKGRVGRGGAEGGGIRQREGPRRQMSASCDPAGAGGTTCEVHRARGLCTRPRLAGQLAARGALQISLG